MRSLRENYYLSEDANAKEKKRKNGERQTGRDFLSGENILPVRNRTALMHGSSVDVLLLFLVEYLPLAYRALIDSGVTYAPLRSAFNSTDIFVRTVERINARTLRQVNPSVYNDAERAACNPRRIKRRMGEVNTDG